VNHHQLHRRSRRTEGLLERRGRDELSATLAVLEIDPIIFTMSPRRLWLIWGIGIRAHGEYRDPDRNQREPFITLKLRGLFG
jgi:hypothetical protein